MGLRKLNPAALLPVAALAMTALVLSRQPDGGGERLHPLPEGPVRTLPSLDRSDAPVRAALSRIPGADALSALLPRDGIIRALVAGVDAANRDPRARGDPGRAAWLEAYARAAGRVDAKRAMALYGRYYPLFQQAYAELGHRDEYFNDALVLAIDNVLASGASSDALDAKLREARALLALHPARSQPER